MIFRELLANQLKEKKADFTSFSNEQRDSLSVYLEKIQRLEQVSLVEISERLKYKLETGAMPSAELDKYKKLSIRFGESWNNHEESRKWAGRHFAKSDNICR